MSDKVSTTASNEVVVAPTKAQLIQRVQVLDDAFRVEYLLQRTFSTLSVGSLMSIGYTIDYYWWVSILLSAIFLIASRFFLFISEDSMNSSIEIKIKLGIMENGIQSTQS